jgi:nicotinamidase-related amidase
MTLTAIDPKTALIVVDLQKGIAGYPTVHPFADVVANTNRLSAGFRARGLPVVFIVAAGGSPGRTEQANRAPAELPAGFTDLAHGLDRQSDEHILTKMTRGAFASTGLDAQLKAWGVTQVVLTGVATSNGVESTARHAYELGYHVTLATDAMTDTSADNHEYSMANIFPRLGQRGTTAEILDLLDTPTA